ncbi:MAG TPA: 4Fe-4S binding protein [Anaerolineae bacterium]|nr:4Fe-4S binding protein [Anaerolineae bacterium]
MATDAYQRLAKHLDGLPGGYPPTESGVELRILRRLFTPEEAELALSLTLLAEEPRVISRRAGITTAEAAERLEAMEKKGLIYAVHSRRRGPRYMASQFVIGIWEYQVGRLTPELVHDFEEYLPTLSQADVWKRVPQLRTIPVGEAVDARLEVLSYERAEEIVRGQNRIAVAPCICRQEKRLVGEGCDKPLETCLVFGAASDFYARNSIGRAITQEEALAVLRLAESSGLVLQPGNSQHTLNICACCGCCCGVLRTLKRYPDPARYLTTSFVAVVNAETCEGCGICTARCQMDAIRLDGKRAVVDPGRCLGCGLCVTTCPTGSLRLARKPEFEQPLVPRDVVDSAIRLGQARGKMRWPALAWMVLRSQMDRLLARR